MSGGSRKGESCQCSHREENRTSLHRSSSIGVPDVFGGRIIPSAGPPSPSRDLCSRFRPLQAMRKLEPAPSTQTSDWLSGRSGQRPYSERPRNRRPSRTIRQILVHRSRVNTSKSCAQAKLRSACGESTHIVNKKNPAWPTILSLSRHGRCVGSPED